ncbi:hypothetical protein LIER_15546 [Lithospermum erythrorhizon]|uniref:Uncharacterized protein n=1 Tax=Lithospermum erythrorhizon TaxID=34254 RepID=A0AAV3Q7Z0_LITER
MMVLGLSWTASYVTRVHVLPGIGLKPICYFEEEETSLNLATRFLLAMDENSVDTILDPQVRETANMEELRVLTKLFQKCLSMNENNRPSVSSIQFVTSSSDHSPLLSSSF